MAEPPSDHLFEEYLHDQTATSLITGALNMVPLLDGILSEPDPDTREVRIMAAQALVDRALGPGCAGRLTKDQEGVLWIAKHRLDEAAG